MATRRLPLVRDYFAEVQQVAVLIDEDPFRRPRAGTGPAPTLAAPKRTTCTREDPISLPAFRPVDGRGNCRGQERRRLKAGPVPVRGCAR